MLVNATFQKLAGLGLTAMADALGEQLSTPGPYAELSFEDRLGLLVDQEADARDSRRLKTRLGGQAPLPGRRGGPRPPRPERARPAPSSTSPPAGWPTATTWCSPGRPGWASP